MIRAAKGLEWDAVYVIHAADGNIPSDMATGSVDEIEEERRLFYVACTRARDALYVTYPLRYYVHGSPWTDTHGYAQRTRFLTDGVLPSFVQVEARPAPAEDDSVLPAATSVSIREELKRLW